MKCPYCKNTSGLRDERGGCISCGAQGERGISYSGADAQTQMILGHSTHHVGPVPHVSMVGRQTGRLYSWKDATN